MRKEKGAGLLNTNLTDQRNAKRKAISSPSCGGGPAVRSMGAEGRNSQKDKWVRSKKGRKAEINLNSLGRLNQHNNRNVKEGEPSGEKRSRQRVRKKNGGLCGGGKKKKEKRIVVTSHGRHSENAYETLPRDRE